jgi:hypothetical protein
MTNEEEQPNRPNSKYKLSKPDWQPGTNPREEEKTTFYYNRERRLEKAPQNVKELFVNKKFSRFNIVRPLIADRPRAVLFFTIVILSVVIFIFSRIGMFDMTHTLEGNNIEITGMKFDGATIVVLGKTARRGFADAYSGHVDLTVFPAEMKTFGDSGQSPVFYHRVFFTKETFEEYRFAVPFDSDELVMVLRTENTTLQVNFKTD